jgi:predicted TPR repeat methyltransferase
VDNLTRRIDNRARGRVCRSLRLVGAVLLAGFAGVHGCQKPQGNGLPEPVGAGGPPGAGVASQGALPPNHPAITPSGARSDPSAPAVNRLLPAGTRNPMEDIMAFKARLDKDPNDVEALISLANANMVISRFDAAQDLYRRALDITPKNLDVRTNLAIAYKYGGKPAEAFAELQKNLAIDPKHGHSLYNLGFLYLTDKQDRAKAVETWKAWLRLYPDDPGAAEISTRIAEFETQPKSGAARSGS